MTDETLFLLSASVESFVRVSSRLPSSFSSFDVVVDRLLAFYPNDIRVLTLARRCLISVKPTLEEMKAVYEHCRANLASPHR